MTHSVCLSAPSHASLDLDWGVIFVGKGGGFRQVFYPPDSQTRKAFFLVAVTEGGRRGVCEEPQNREGRFGPHLLLLRCFSL